MRREAPLIIGAGPAGCAAGLALARMGHRATIWERQRTTGDALCGGFLSWVTVRRLETLGLAPLGGQVIRRVRVFAGTSHATAELPAPATGVSRYRLDTRMQDAFEKAGGSIVRGAVVRRIEKGSVIGDSESVTPESLFLASGKNDIRGLARPRGDAETAIGLRIRLPATPSLRQTIGDAIELHLFDGGYAGLLLQEDGSTNLCLAVRKARLSEADGDPARLLDQLGRENAALGERIGFWSGAPIDAIAAVPYGWRAKATVDGVFRLGDQAAVIPSLAGEGMGIAIASGLAAAETWHVHGRAGAHAYQTGFARRTARPVAWARRFWHLGERPLVAGPATRLLRSAPFLTGLAARLTRIGD